MSELATTEQPQPWHRQPKETPQAFHAFNLYREQAPPRTIRAASVLHAETRPGKKGNVETVYVGFKVWAVKWNWRERADAFDLMLDRQRLAARETERQRVDREHAAEGRYIRSAAVTRLTGGTAPDGTPIIPIDWNDVDFDSVLSAYRLGMTTERQAVGLAIGNTLGMVPTAHARQVLEELFRLSLEFIAEDRQQMFVQRAQALAEANR